MDCNRLKSLVKSWYVHVQDETLAPARMVEFIEKHLAECQVCLRDPDLRMEVDKIVEIVLPPSKAIKVIKRLEDEDLSVQDEAFDEGEAVGVDEELDEELDEDEEEDLLSGEEDED